MGPEGERIDSPLGRLINPGHAIELAWFLIHFAKKRDDSQLIDLSLNIVRWTLEKWWDSEYGGLYYFVDAKGKPSMKLEHNMKLWWPHTEALYATLLAYSLSQDEFFIDWHIKIRDYSFDKFKDSEHGEWFGYLDRYGNPTHTLKGGEWKGFFHLPRALLFCINTLESMNVKDG